MHGVARVYTKCTRIAQVACEMYGVSRLNTWIARVAQKMHTGSYGRTRTPAVAKVGVLRRDVTQSSAAAPHIFVAEHVVCDPASDAPWCDG